MPRGLTSVCVILSSVRIVQYLKWLRLADGGVVRAVLDLSAALARAGHEVVVLTADDSGVPEEWKREKLGSHPLPRSVLLELMDPLDWLRGRRTAEAAADTPTQRLTRASVELAKAEIGAADVLHLHGPWTPSNHVLARLAARAGVPHVVSPHGMLDRWCMEQGAIKKRLSMALIGRRTFDEARAVHFTAAAELDQARAVLSVSAIARGAVVPLVFDTSLFRSLPGPGLARAEMGLKADETLFVFVSRIHHKKGVGVLLRAAAAIGATPAGKGRPFRVVVAGPSDPPEYVETMKALAVELGIGDLVLFPGLVSGPLKVSLYQAASAFVLPTQQENFGFVLIEALLAGAPVITTQGVDIWPELESSGGATITDGSVAEVARAMSGVWEDGKGADGLASAERSARARTWALEFVDEVRIVKRFESLYSEGAKLGTRFGPGLV